jgi:GPH family glycoside/pentoside/hexuronide:cation symporter
MQSADSLLADSMLDRPADNAAARRRPLGLRFKFFYGAGALVEGTTTAALTYFLLFYLTSVCGLSGTAAGTALLVGLLIDAVADPLIGLVSDNTRSRLGRRLPYLLFGTVPLAIAFALLFSIPASLEGAALIGYATVCAMAVRIGQSVYNLPYVAVGAEVSDDYQERSSIVAYRISFTMLGTFAVIALGLGVFMTGSTGLSDRAAYIPFAWSCAAIIAIGGFAGAYATRGAGERLHASAQGEGPLLGGFARELRDVFRNRSFVVIFVAVLAFFVAQGMASALAIHLNRYFWMLSDRCRAAHPDRRNARPVPRRAARGPSLAPDRQAQPRDRKLPRLRRRAILAPGCTHRGHPHA